MQETIKSSLWKEQGYSLFAEDGLEGIQIERLARILNLNKSSFYHYFADLEGYCAELLKLHNKKIDDFLQDVEEIEKLDPDYLLLLIKHGTMVMFQVQLIQQKENQSFHQVSEEGDLKVNSAIQHLWSEFLGVPINHNLILRYYLIVRDMFYMRVSSKNLNYHFLHNLFTEAKQLATQFTSQQSQQPSSAIFRL